MHPVAVVAIVVIVMVVVGVGLLFWMSESGLRKIAAMPPQWIWHGLPIPMAKEACEETTDGDGSTTLHFAFENQHITPVYRWFLANWPPSDMTMHDYKKTTNSAQHVLLPRGQQMDDMDATPVVFGLTETRPTEYSPRTVIVTITDGRSMSDAASRSDTVPERQHY